MAKLNIAETGLESFGLRTIYGVDRALDETAFRQIVSKCSNLKNFVFNGLDFAFSQNEEAGDSLLGLARQILDNCSESLKSMDLSPVMKVKCPDVAYEFLKDTLSLEMEQLECLSLSRNQSLPEEKLKELIQIVGQASYFSQLKELSLPIIEGASDELVQSILDFFTN